MHLPKLAAALIIASAAALSAQHVSAHKASLIDVPARQAYLQATKEPLLLTAIHKLPSCLALPFVTAPTGPMNIPHHYISGGHGPINPAEAKAAKIYYDFEGRITAGMNQYVATGSHAEAKCALDQLDAWATANTLMNYDPNVNGDSQSWFQAEWTLGACGVTLSVLVNDPTLSLPELKSVALWLDTAARKLVGFEKPGKPGNNHHYWRALAATSIGVACSDDALFKFGVDTFHEAVNQLDKNGAFPLEMERHERSTHYQGFALQPLILIAEFGSRQGLDLYGYTANGRTIRDAVVFFGKIVDDPSLIKQYTPDEQLKEFGQDEFAPYTFYTARFGDSGLPPAIPKYLTRSLMATRLGGNTTILAEK
ncbi:MAG: alginate lyase family protein [Acidobacteriota bacterium]